MLRMTLKRINIIPRKISLVEYFCDYPENMVPLGTSGLVNRLGVFPEILVALPTVRPTVSGGLIRAISP